MGKIEGCSNLNFYDLVLLAEKAKAEKLAQKKLKAEEKAKKKAELAYKNRTKKKGRS